MGKFILDQKYKIGHEKIDEQHTKILEYLKYALDGLQAKNMEKREYIINLIEDVKQYAKVHLEYEELQMQKEEYPEIIKHKLEHDKFREKVKDLRFENKDSLENLKEVATFLRDWFLNHIAITDKQFGDFLQERKLKKTVHVINVAKKEGTHDQ